MRGKYFVPTAKKVPFSSRMRAANLTFNQIERTVNCDIEYTIWKQIENHVDRSIWNPILGAIRRHIHDKL